MEPTKTETLTLNFTTVSAVHPLDNETLEITMKDLEAEKGDGILDERWVYERPGIAFASSGRLAAAKTQYGDDKVVEMHSLFRRFQLVNRRSSKNRKNQKFRVTKEVIRDELQKEKHVEY